MSRMHLRQRALNFVANAPEVVGFDPFVDLVDLILARASAHALAA
jgi:hypothetical protein